MELLDRRSATYSSRPNSVMACEIVGWGLGLAFLPYNDRMRRTRRMLQEGMSTKAMPDLWPLQEQEAIKFVRRLLETPQELNRHIHQTAGAIVLKLVYGYNVEDGNDRFINLADNAMVMFSLVTTPGAFVVDIFPFLRHLPWFKLKTEVKAWRKLLSDFVELPMKFVYDKMQSGEGQPCLVSRWLEREVKPNEQAEGLAQYNESLIKWGAMSLYGGGSDTTVSAISLFFAAMTLYPAVQAKAQAEIAKIVGTDRLPTYSDRASLPYIEALYKEVLRFHSIVPIGIPHRLDANEDDEYRGMRIPNGATLFANIWKMVSDPDMYHDPATFNPERFLGPIESVERNPEDIVFGFGRRRCPGINVAHSSVWLSIALTLATCNITPSPDSDGKPKLPTGKYTNQTISHPEPFECTITPRSEKAATLIKEASI